MKIKHGMIAAVLVGLVSGVFAAPATLVQTVTYNSETITMRLTLQNLRGSNFELWSQNTNGTYDVITPVAERSYIGTVDEYPGAVSCGILKDDGTTFWGAVYFDRGATWFTQGTSVTSTRGTTPTTAFNFPSGNVTAGHAGSVTYGFDVGIDANYEYYTTRAGSDIDTTFEMVEYSVALTRALYIRDALLRPYLGRVIIRTSQAHDPEQGHTTDGAYLTAMTTEWNTNHADSNFDLVAGIARGLHDYGGLASSGYSVNGSDANGNFSIVWRHEMGHNWGLGHYDGGNPEGATINSGNEYARMSGPEVERALNRRDDRLGIIDDEGTFGAVNLPPYAAVDSGVIVRPMASSVTVDVMANDHDANGHTFSISSFDATTLNGGTIVQSGSGASAQLVYTANGSYIGQDSFTYTITDSSGQVAQGVVVVDVRPDDPLVLHLPLDETSGEIAEDKSVFGNDGTFSGADSLSEVSVSGKFGTAVSMDGVDDHFTAESLNVNSDRVTLTAWIKRPDTTQSEWAGIIFNRSQNAAGLNFGTANELRYHWDGGYYNYNSGLIPPANQWVFVALVVEPTQATIYMHDGSSLQQSTSVGTHNAQSFGGTTYIGRDPNSSSRSFTGDMDDPRVYGRALAQVEILELIDGGRAEAPSPFNGAVNVESSMVSWAPGGSATGYDVYIGTSQAAVAAATKASPEYQETTVDAQFRASLSDSTTYYWRIDTVTASATLAGSVWSFTTGVVPIETYSIGFNFTSDWSAPTIQGEGDVDGTADWTDSVNSASAPEGAEVPNSTDPYAVTTPVNASMVSVAWSSSNMYDAGNESNTDQALYRVYLDDGGSGPEVTVSGLSAWLADIGATEYQLDFYRNSDGAANTFARLDIYDGTGTGGALLESLPATAAAGDGAYPTGTGGGGSRLKQSAVGTFSADVVTFHSDRNLGGGNRAGVAGFRITAVSAPDNDNDGIPDATDPDDDNDGIPDAWETANGLNPLVDDAALHSDSDAFDNWYEYVTDTDPQDENSFQTFWIAPSAGNAPVARFSTSSNRWYTLRYRDDLTSGSWMDLGPAFLGTGFNTNMVDSASVSQRFYRLNIELP